MRFIFGFFLLIQVCAQAFFPVLETTSDIKNFFPQSKAEITAIKEEVINSFIDSIDEILSSTTNVKKELIQNWDKLLGQAKVYSELMTTLSMVMPSKKLRQACQSAAVEIEQKMHEKVMHSPELYEKFRSITEDKSLNKEDRRYLNQILNSFKVMGIGLNKGDRQKVIDISAELTDLCSCFQKNIMEDASYILATDTELEGVSPSLVSSLKKNDEGFYILSCDYPVVFPVLSQCSSAKLRKALLNAFHNRAHPKNTHLLEKIIAKRDEAAKILGFDSFSDLQLNQMLVKSQSNANDFLHSLLKSVSFKEKQEFQSLKECAPKDFEFARNGSIFPHDTYYLWNHFYKENRSLDSEKISEYFSLGLLFENSLPFLEEFYNVKIELSKTNDLWVDNLTVLKIQRNEVTLGHIVLDLFPRAGKYSHACMCPIIPAYTSDDGTLFTALNVVIANFPPPVEKNLSFMTIKNVRTLYHELGHAFHDILGRTDYIMTAGTNVAIDFVEMPSQLMEEWLYEKAHLKRISQHFLDSNPLPDAIIDRIIEARKDDIATLLQRQVFLSLLSLEYFKAGAQKNTSKIYEQLFSFCLPNYDFCPNHHFQASFGHLDGYGATYYGYLWSKVIALNIFENFKKDGLIQNDRIRGYVEQILQKGNSVDLMQAVESYLKRSINIDSFLQRLSIDGIEKNYD